MEVWGVNAGKRAGIEIIREGEFFRKRERKNTGEALIYLQLRISISRRQSVVLWAWATLLRAIETCLVRMAGSNSRYTKINTKRGSHPSRLAIRIKYCLEFCHFSWNNLDNLENISEKKRGKKEWIWSWHVLTIRCVDYVIDTSAIEGRAGDDCKLL